MVGVVNDALNNARKFPLADNGSADKPLLSIEGPVPHSNPLAFSHVCFPRFSSKSRLFGSHRQGEVKAR
jgi:hypothetical protein